MWKLLAVSPVPAGAQERGGSQPIDQARFELVSRGSNFELKASPDGRRRPLSIPRHWLIPPDAEKADSDRYVSPFDYNRRVNAFDIGQGKVGIHLSSYATQETGSAQAAAGRDVFLVYDRRTNRLVPGLLNLGITKERVRVMGCFSATATKFLLADINDDRLLDIGIVREELACRRVVHQGVDAMEGPFYVQYPIRWHLFRGNRWIYHADFDRRFPETKYWQLPLIDLVKTPVDYVMDVFRQPH